MAFDELREKASEAEAEVKAYVGLSAEYYELKAFKIGMRGILYLSKCILLGFFATLTLVFLSVAAAYALGEAVGDVALGFLIVGGVYLLLLLIAYLFRDSLEKPILKRFSTYFFE